jgi:RNA:NAD 2'-phosphotransferase (TPT1/KptA family)
VFRRRPERIGLKLDEAGWTPVVDLLEAYKRHGFPNAF